MTLGGRHDRGRRGCPGEGLDGTGGPAGAAATQGHSTEAKTCALLVFEPLHVSCRRIHDAVAVPRLEHPRYRLPGDLLRPVRVTDQESTRACQSETTSTGSEGGWLGPAEHSKREAHILGLPLRSASATRDRCRCPFGPR